MSIEMTNKGPAINTGNNFDFMIEGDGYFQVNTQEGLGIPEMAHLLLIKGGFD